MMSPATFMGPAVGASISSLIFAMVASISYCSDYQCVKNTYFLKEMYEPKSGADKTEIFHGLSHYARIRKEDEGEETELSCPYAADPLCNYIQEDADDKCGTKEDTCFDDCAKKCEGSDPKCEENCENSVKDSRARKFAFSAAILGVVFFLTVVILSGLRLGAMNNVAVQVVAIVLSFLSFTFLLSSFAVFMAHPKKHMELDHEEGDYCSTQADCSVKMGPGLILTLLAWMFALVPLVCHAICPTGKSSASNANTNNAKELESKV